jgi:hypothetical protein
MNKSYNKKINPKGKAIIKEIVEKCYESLLLGKIHETAAYIFFKNL